METIKSPNAPERCTVTEETLASAMRMAREGQTWMEKNRDAFESIVGYLKSLQAENIKGRVRDRVATWCMENGIRIDDNPYRFANAKWAVISRYAALVDPTLIGRPLQFSFSMVDLSGLLPVSYLEIGDAE